VPGSTATRAGGAAGPAAAFVTTRASCRWRHADGRNYFEVEASLRDTLPQLRPGLSGVAKVEAGSQPLAWLLFAPRGGLAAPGLVEGHALVSEPLVSASWHRVAPLRPSLVAGSASCGSRCATRSGTCWWSRPAAARCG
jgi:hypothetical protein